MSGVSRSIPGSSVCFAVAYGSSVDSSVFYGTTSFLLTLVLEEGGRRLAGWEQRTGRRLDDGSHRFVWKVVLNVGRLWMLLDANRMKRDTIGAEAGEAFLSTLPATWGTARQMENAVRLREVHDNLTEDQWRVMESKMAGYSAVKVAEKRGGSPDAVNMVFSRAKRKLARLLNRVPSGASDRSPEQRTPVPGRESSSSDGADTGRRDGELAPAPRLVCVHRRE
jgi:hypothetical protein